MFLHNFNVVNFVLPLIYSYLFFKKIKEMVLKKTLLYVFFMQET